MSIPTIGVLGLQGCIEPHFSHIKKVGCRGTLVREAKDLNDVDGLILPGGESSTMLRLIERRELQEPLEHFFAERPAWGICAGSILLAKEVVNPYQFSFGRIAIRAHRNFYGSQQESFSDSIQTILSNQNYRVDFIRAPKLEPLDDEVQILASRQKDDILFRQGPILVSAFHTELTEDPWLHDYFKSFL